MIIGKIFFIGLFLTSCGKEIQEQKTNKNSSQSEKKFLNKTLELKSQIFYDQDSQRFITENSRKKFNQFYFGKIPPFVRISKGVSSEVIAKIIFISSRPEESLICHYFLESIESSVLLLKTCYDAKNEDFHFVGNEDFPIQKDSSIALVVSGINPSSDIEVSVDIEIEKP